MIPHHGSNDSLLFLKPVIIILSILMFHTYVCIAQEYNPERYEKCKSNFVCGNRVNVGFPFHGDHHNDGRDRPDYCGLPGYKLDCYKGDIAEIKFLDEIYRVLDINLDSQVMNITNKDLADDACASKYPRTPYVSAVFKLPSPDVYQLISIFSDCSDINIRDQYKFKCQKNDAGSDSSASNDAYFLLKSPLDTPHISSCNRTVEVPVMSAFIKDLMARPETLPTVIKLGFNVTYLKDESGISINWCPACMRSGGTCGYNTATNNPTCYCLDGNDACFNPSSAAAAPSPGMFLS
ncbi:hypothetical protein C5167_005398 [Papaver somniferum]|uniref:Wall-associated receptor kinase C-terminal domain-containing protein n=1 Tax=Papaver somniferum TaxID=3469 RepID=A0A4Y7JEB2_PAPSO|nr:hypothetical protein C5167_005398 [Papaver somniferum]